jgi:uncharacterized RDD family membrane protein YckC
VAGPIGRYYADVPNRLVALLIDAIVLSVLTFIGALILSALFGPVVRFDLGAETLNQEIRIANGLAIVDSFLAMAICAAYFMISWVFLEGSLGQRALGMKIGRETRDAPLVIGQALVRWILLGAPFGIAAVLTTAFPSLNDGVIDLVVLAWYLVLLITVARSPTKQGLHDRIARTVVVKKASAVAWTVSAAPERAPVR